MKTAYFDTDGFLIVMVQGEHNEVAGARAKELDDDADGSELFLNADDTIVTSRASITPTVSKLSIVADNTDISTITNLPNPCWLLVNGQRTHVGGGSYDVTADTATSLYISLIGPHKSDTIIIEATELEEFKATLKVHAETYREQKIDAGCTTTFGVVDSDESSRSLINGSVTMASLSKSAGLPFSINWRMKNNTYVMLNADEMISMGLQVGHFVSQCFTASFAVKDAISAATTTVAAYAVNLSAGYPA